MLPFLLKLRIIHINLHCFFRCEMALAGKYFRLQRNDQSQEGQDVDLEDNASDTTKTSSTGELFDKTAFLSLRDDADVSAPSFAHRWPKRAKMSSNFWTWLRWGTVVGLQTIMILLLCLKQSGSTNPTNNLIGVAAGGQFVETGGDINGLYKTREFCLSRFDHLFPPN